MSQRVPKVSLGLPVYNGEKLIARALDSILAQTFTDFELVITDNASTDGTEAACRAYAARDERVRYHRNAQNLGAMPNFNLAFELCRAEYFKWCSHDDVLGPDFLKECVEVLDREPETVLCFTRRALITEAGERVPGEADSESYHRIGFARMVELEGRIAPLMVHGLVRARALRATRLLGSYFGSDNVLVAELRLLGEISEVPRVMFFESFRGYVPKDRNSAKRWQAWVDARKKSGVRLPRQVKLELEYHRAISRAKHPAGARCRMHWSVVRIFVLRGLRNFKEWATRPLGNLAARSWVSAARGLSDGSSARARLLVSLFALRHGDLAALRRAWGGGSQQGPFHLAAYVAERLRRNKDPEAARVLSDWITSGRPELRQASAAILACASKELFFNLRKLFSPEECERLTGMANAALARQESGVSPNGLAGAVR